MKFVLVCMGYHWQSSYLGCISYIVHLITGICNNLIVSTERSDVVKLMFGSILFFISYSELSSLMKRFYTYSMLLYSPVCILYGLQGHVMRSFVSLGIWLPVRPSPSHKHKEF